MFGLHYFEPKEEFDTRPPIDTVGCVAEVREVQEMPDGRSKLILKDEATGEFVDVVS